KFISLLKQTEGDVAETFIALFKHMLIKFKDQENRSFFKNTFLNMNHKIEHVFTEGIRVTEDFSEISDIIDTQKLNISHVQEVMYIAKIIGVFTVNKLKQNFAKEIPLHAAVRNYEFGLDLVNRGIFLKEEILY